MEYQLHTPADQKEGTREPSDTDSPGTDTGASQCHKLLRVPPPPLEEHCAQSKGGWGKGALMCAPEVRSGMRALHRAREGQKVVLLNDNERLLN